ncbi:hypothetical protein CHS0354_022919, partial [Potamilus streckersoni]
FSCGFEDYIEILKMARLKALFVVFITAFSRTSALSSSLPVTTTMSPTRTTEVDTSIPNTFTHSSSTLSAIASTTPTSSSSPTTPTIKEDSTTNNNISHSSSAGSELTSTEPQSPSNETASQKNGVDPSHSMFGIKD